MNESQLRPVDKSNFPKAGRPSSWFCGLDFGTKNFLYRVSSLLWLGNLGLQSVFAFAIVSSVRQLVAG